MPAETKPVEIQTEMQTIGASLSDLPVAFSPDSKFFFTASGRDIKVSSILTSELVRTPMLNAAMVTGRERKDG
jgi:hypothetical protein